MVEWSDGVRAGDGCIYGIPDCAASVFCYDPEQGQATTFGEVGFGAHKWSGGVLAGDGKIYCVPWSHPHVLCIDPAAREVSFILPRAMGEASSLSFAALAEDAVSAEHKWRGGVLAQDGKIYCVPWNAEAVLCIDPSDGVASTFGQLDEAGSKWSGAVAAPDGKIYCVPYDAQTVLQIDPASCTAVTLGDFGNGKRKWRGGVLCGDGLIYCIPYSAMEVLCIDPTGGEDGAAVVSTFGMAGGIRCKWRGAALADDGRIYCVPDCAPEVLCIDPYSKSLSTFGEVGDRKWKWRGGVLGQDGRIYCSPYDTLGAVLCIWPSHKKAFPLDGAAIVSCSGLQLPGLVRSPDGNAYCTPLS